ncbi:MAG TPA: hypothetical protein DCE18_14915 [Syntrophobacteraceae bacterium]|nr:hypothetical protein [Syntrophobacteraceae bacterium]
MTINMTASPLNLYVEIALVKKSPSDIPTKPSFIQSGASPLHVGFQRKPMGFNLRRGLPLNSMLLTQAAGVIPAKAGIQGLCGFLDPGFRRGDVNSTALAPELSSPGRRAMLLN